MVVAVIERQRRPKKEKRIVRACARPHCRASEREGRTTLISSVSNCTELSLGLFVVGMIVVVVLAVFLFVTLFFFFFGLKNKNPASNKSEQLRDGVHGEVKRKAWFFFKPARLCLCPPLSPSARNRQQ